MYCSVLRFINLGYDFLGFLEKLCINASNGTLLSLFKEKKQVTLRM